MSSDNKKSYWDDIFVSFVDRLFLFIVLLLIGFIVQQSIPKVEATAMAQREFRQSQAKVISDTVDFVLEMSIEKAKAVYVIDNLIAIFKNNIPLSPEIAEAVLDQLMVVDNLLLARIKTDSSVLLYMDSEFTQEYFKLMKMYVSDEKVASILKVRERIFKIVSTYFKNETFTARQQTLILTTAYKIRSIYAESDEEKKLVIEHLKKMKTQFPTLYN